MKSIGMSILLWLFGLVSLGLMVALSVAASVIVIPLAIGLSFYVFYIANKNEIRS